MRIRDWRERRLGSGRRKEGRSGPGINGRHIVERQVTILPRWKYIRDERQELRNKEANHMWTSFLLLLLLLMGIVFWTASQHQQQSIYAQFEWWVYDYIHHLQVSRRNSINMSNFYKLARDVRKIRLMPRLCCVCRNFAILGRSFGQVILRTLFTSVDKIS